eukprot:Lankesteria_metandrocarpae@DN3155_c0_g1_i1.p1
MHGFYQSVMGQGTIVGHALPCPTTPRGLGKARRRNRLRDLKKLNFLLLDVKMEMSEIAASVEGVFKIYSDQIKSGTVNKEELQNYLRAATIYVLQEQCEHHPVLKPLAVDALLTGSETFKKSAVKLIQKWKLDPEKYPQAVIFAETRAARYAVRNISPSELRSICRRHVRFAGATCRAYMESKNYNCAVQVYRNTTTSFVDQNFNEFTQCLPPKMVKTLKYNSESVGELSDSEVEEGSDCSVGRDVILQLMRGSSDSDPMDIITLVDNIKELRDVVQLILENCEVIAVDGEWLPQLSPFWNCPVSIFQICPFWKSGRRHEAFILDLQNLRNDGSTGEADSLVASLLRSEELIKVGVAVHKEDWKKLCSSAPSKYDKLAAYVDLGQVAVLAADAYQFSGCSLAALVEVVLGVQLDKQSRLVDWRQRPLPQRKLFYAACDVLAVKCVVDRVADRLEYDSVIVLRKAALLRIPNRLSVKSAMDGTGECMYYDQESQRQTGV